MPTFVKGYGRKGQFVRGYVKGSGKHRLIQKIENKGSYATRRWRNVARIEKAMDKALSPGREKRKASLFKRFETVVKY